jgi:hypothetical protein
MFPYWNRLGVRRRVIGAVAALLLLASTAPAVDYHGTISRIDVDKGVVYLKTKSGQEAKLSVAKDLKVFDEMGKELPDGLKAKELKDGVEVTFKRLREKGEEKEAIQVIFLGNRKRRMVGDGSARNSVGFKPLSEMTAEDKYLGEDGGLYGNGKNEPPEKHQGAAKRETEGLVPLDKDGKPAADGKIVLISLSMSNATQEFSAFKTLADADAQKSPRLTIVDCAQGSMTMAAWANTRAKPNPWPVAIERLEKAGVTPAQVQVLWIKPANAFPKGDLLEHGKELQEDTQRTLQRARERFPNLRIAYFSSRIYGGHATGGGADLNPEPYAYETAFVVRWLIQDQIKGNPELNHDATRGPVKSPLLLWGPYLWADGDTPRKADGLAWPRKDLSSDGTHPSDSGKEKVAQALLRFFKNDPNTKTWFVGRAADTGK